MDNTVNPSGIQPCGTLVLVQMKLIEGKTASGLVTCTPQELERQQMGQFVGVMVAKGKTAYHDFQDKPEIGQHVFVKKYAGTHIEGKDGKAYRLCKDLEAPAVITDPSLIKETI